MRDDYRVWLAIIVIIAALLFAWWASGEVYDPKPTKSPTVSIPTRVTVEWVTATAFPTATLTPIVTQTVAPTATNTPQPTITAAETEPSATETQSATLAPTATTAETEQPIPECEMLVYKHNRAIYYPYCWEWLR